MTFFIVNYTDTPRPSLLAYKRDDGKLNYVDRRMRSYDGMGISHATPIEDFGFDVYINGQEAVFKKNRTSDAKYSDGRPRTCQGEDFFGRRIPEDAA